MGQFNLDFKSLREKWCEVPQEGGRLFSSDLLTQDTATFVSTWRSYYTANIKAESGRWYYELYKEFMREKSVLEIGSGLGFDGIHFLQGGAESWTFCDIAEANLQVIRRVCGELGLRGNFIFIDGDFKCFDKLGMFDVIWANGSLIHVPFAFARAECMRILPHLNPGGRWIELCYPKQRWVREGRLPFSEWGKVTDGERTPWVEWYDIVKMKRRLFPALLEVILDFNFHEGFFNWFDLRLSSAHPFDPTEPVVDIDVHPAGVAADAHGDAALEMRGALLAVTTPEAIWSYAASFEISAAIAASRHRVGSADDAFIIEVELKVERGHVGVLVVSSDISAPVCQEYVVGESVDDTSLMITVPRGSGAQRLIFRNVAAGLRSRFEVRRIRLRFLASEPK
jgi:Methyltransferase domain